MAFESFLNFELKKPTVLIFGISLILVLAGCDPADQTPTVNLDEASPSEIYPEPNLQDTASPESYPAPFLQPTSEQAYPIPTPDIEIESPYPVEEATNYGTLLALDKPITASDKSVNGVGPPGLTVFIINITFMGELLGSGAIKDDGTFSVLVDGLEPGIQVGLTADIESFGFNTDDVKPGEGQINVPQVGYFYDTYVIRE